MKSDVTIAIPCYNHEKFIEFCLNSIKDEGYPYKKILIVDDGSTDDSISVIEQWKANNPSIALTLIRRENRGLNFTLNELIRRCDTEFFCMLASDDALYPGGIANRIAVLNSNPSKLAVIGDAKVIDESNEIVYESAIEDLYNGDKKKYKTDDGLKYSVINQFSVPGAVLLVRTKLYDKIGFYPNIFAEDIYFYLKTIGMELLIFLDEPVGYYRKHANNTTGNLKYAKQINQTFLYSYAKNFKYYRGVLFIQLLRKFAGQVVDWFRIRFRENLS